MVETQGGHGPQGGRRGDARERLLAAAAGLTYAGGIAATGVDAIAREAGVTKRTLYQHFGSKDALVGAALAARDEPAIAALRGAVERRQARGAAPLDALFGTLERVFARDGFRGCAFLNAGLEVADRDHPLHAAVAAHLAGRRALVADVVRAEGVDDPAVAGGVAVLVEGAFALAGATGDVGAAAHAHRAARDLVDAARGRPAAGERQPG